MKKEISKLFYQECNSAGKDADYYIEKGKEILDEEFFEGWKIELESYKTAPLLYGYMAYAAVLDIVEALKDNTAKSFTITLMIFKAQNHSRASYWLILNMVVLYSKYGKEFAEYIKEVEAVVGAVV